MDAQKSKPLAEIVAPGLHRYGPVPGLYVQVGREGGRSWLLRYSLNGKRRDLGLGSLAKVTATDAAKLARAARKQIAAGIDPVGERTAERAKTAKAKADAKVPVIRTFKAAAAAFQRAQGRQWSADHAAEWARSVKGVLPALGALHPRDIEVPHVVAAIKPNWEKNPIKMSRTAQRVAAVLDFCRAQGVIKGPWENPSDWEHRLKYLLPAVATVHTPRPQPALPVEKAADFMKALKDRPGMAARCLEFLILTAVRASEATGARRTEIDLGEGIWTIPATRMKAGREHIVPLPQAALELVENLPRIQGDDDLLFPAPRGGELRSLALRRVIDDMGGKFAGWADRNGDTVVPHGFRSTFRDFCGDHTDYPREVAEAALAHAVGNASEQAYRRGSALAKRRALMADWAIYLGAQDPPADNVMDLENARRRMVATADG